MDEWKKFTGYYWKYVLKLEETKEDMKKKLEKINLWSLK